MRTSIYIIISGRKSQEKTDENFFNKNVKFIIEKLTCGMKLASNITTIHYHES